MKTPSRRLEHFSLPRLFLFATLTATLVLLHWARAGAAPQQTTGARIEQAAKEPQNWLTFFGNYQAWSYSPLDQITRENVKRVVPAWAFSTGGHLGLQSAPLIADGVLYLVDPDDNIFAMDAATGKPIWKYSYKRPAGPECAPPEIAPRGIAIGYGMIFMGTNNDHLRRRGRQNRPGVLEHRGRRSREVRLRRSIPRRSW